MKARVDAARENGEVPPVDDRSLESAYYPLAERLAASARASVVAPRFIALVGPPGCGKTTLSAYLELILDAGYGLRSARFGIDDAYLGRKERAQMAREVHPLFATRGAPGTHRLERISETIAALNTANESSETPLPRFDKLTDDPLPRAEWPIFPGRPDVILFDTWLWEVEAPTDTSLAVPVNAREAVEDSAAIWRRAAARFLTERYIPLLQGADEWVLFETPSFEATVRFRREQEEHRRASVAVRQAPPEGRDVRFFLELFERWLGLKHRQAPDYRIVLDEYHRAQFVGAARNA